MNKDNEKNRSCLGTLMIMIAMMIAVSLIGYFITNINTNTDNTDTPTITERKANNSDISINTEYSFPISIKIIIIAEVDIKLLDLQLTFTDASYNTLTTKTKYIGNIEQGETKEIVISLTDFTLEQNLKIRYVSCQVTGGTVSIFQ